ncbi:MAG: hypothetical protein IT435_20395 [Phycisphaerales bacterium]|nr:hypothetical protein [Phycisphaerales bacterium]
MGHLSTSGLWSTVREIAACALCCGLIGSAGSLTGCTLLGGMIESYRQSSTHSVEAEYIGIVGKSVAVVVIADRSIEADFPGITATINERINENVLRNAQPSYGMPSVQLVQYLLNNPQLLAKPRGELAQHLGVQRLIVVELQEFRLNDPGNQYLWEGAASGQVSVVEADGPVSDDYAFSRPIRVGFPDQKGIGPEQYGRDVISSALLGRFVERTSVFFYTHEEPYYPKPGQGY